MELEKLIKKLRRPFSIALLLSLFVHAGLTLYLYIVKVPPPSRPVEIEILDANDIARRMALQKEMERQIVDQSEKAVNDQIDEKTKYWSRHNQKVEHETRAANTGKFQNDAKQGMTAKANNDVKQASKEKPLKVDKRTADKRTTVVKNSEGDVALPKLNDLKPRFDWNKVQAGVQNPGQRSQSNDYLKDVQTGPQTLLSSREFVFFSYYSRIKERIGMFWEPKIKEKVQRILMSGRKLASDQERITKLLIILDANGKLLRVQVIGEAGIHDLDDAAVEAFQAAAPFPNPPKGIVDPDGTIKIHWDFILLEAAAAKLVPTLRGAQAQND